MPTGSLSLFAAIAGGAAPLAGVSVTLRDDDGVELARLTSDEDGQFPTQILPAPDKELSLTEANTKMPYALYRIFAAKQGWQSIDLSGIQIFDGQETVARLEFLPDTEALSPITGGRGAAEIIVEPPHVLFDGAGGSGPAPEETPPMPGRVLTEVIIPRKITVHLGIPSANVSNATVDFQTYIANVASHEIYPTWPEEAIRANILAQISLALNRIYTEWYPSRGFSFNISNSPSYDQKYVHKGTVYAIMERITAELFSTYVRKGSGAEPYFTEYCDGKLVTCPGMKQWGTVDRARSGLNALQILRYYYGSNIQLVTTNRLANIPESYPGTPLRRGDTGPNVSILQRQLARIGKDFPSFGRPNVTGVFDEATENSVKAFQRYFSLTADGVVGRATWLKVSYIYVSVKDLAELTSEGEEFTGTQSSGSWPGTVLRSGSSGRSVELVQFWLFELSQLTSGIPPVTVDGKFGSGTTAAVRAFQNQKGLNPDGIVGQATWNALYEAWVSAQSDAGGTAYPGTALRTGSSGNTVRLVQFWLRIAAGNYPSLTAPTVDGNFGSGTAAAVSGFQQLVGLPADGIVGPGTWAKLREIFLAVTNRLVNAGQLPGAFPGTLRQGSSGTGVRALQYYLRLLSAYYQSIPAVTVDGNFGAATRRAVLAWQQQAGLAADGIVGRQTWESVYTNAQQAAASGPVARGWTPPVLAYPVRVGNTGRDVVTLSQTLLFLSQWLPEITVWPSGQPLDRFNAELETAVLSAQRAFHLPETGIVTEGVWQVFCEAALTLLASSPVLPLGARADDGWPGYSLAQGSAGAEVQQVQRWLNRVAASSLFLPLIKETGFYDFATAEAVTQFQLLFGLKPLGIVDEPTWQALQQADQAADCGCRPNQEV